MSPVRSICAAIKQLAITLLTGTLNRTCSEIVQVRMRLEDRIRIGAEETAEVSADRHAEDGTETGTRTGTRLRTRTRTSLGN